MQDHPSHVVRRLSTKDGVFLTPERDRRWCLGKINPGQVVIRNRHPRAARHRKLGLALDDCGQLADFEIDGQPLCKRHAADRALQILIDENRAAPEDTAP